MRDASALLQAGGIVPPNAALPAGEPTDAVVARTFSHPALGERRVVRLVAESLVPGADAEASALGFGPPAPGPVVGRQRRRAPGFPGVGAAQRPEERPLRPRDRAGPQEGAAHRAEQARACPRRPDRARRQARPHRASLPAVVLGRVRAPLPRRRQPHLRRAELREGPRGRASVLAARRRGRARRGVPRIRVVRRPGRQVPGRLRAPPSARARTNRAPTASSTTCACAAPSAASRRSRAWPRSCARSPRPAASIRRRRSAGS
jgi:hypothetical protein